MKRLLLLGIVMSQSAVWGLEQSFQQPAPYYQIPLENEFKRFISSKSRREPAIATLLAGVPPALAV